MNYYPSFNSGDSRDDLICQDRLTGDITAAYMKGPLGTPGNPSEIAKGFCKVGKF